MNTINIKALSEQVSKLSSSAGSVLPDVTASDNGKVLGVVEGSWNKMDAPSGGVDYSTTEQDTGRKWIDGKNIYQKTIYYAGGTSGGTYTIPHGISNLGKVVRCDGICNDSRGDNQNMCIPRVDAEGANFGISSVNDTNIIFSYSSLWAERLIDLYITIQYTKAEVTKATKKKTTK